MWVFGYGSLAAAGARPGERAVLRGARRRWGVAMDNTREIPGYKVYVDPVTGERPAVAVCFLDLSDDPEGEVDGVLLPVTPEEAAALDVRERNYVRADVTGRVEPSPAGTAVVSREYHDAVVAGFAARGGDALERLARSTEPLGDLPLRDLRRLDLPAR